MAEKSYRIRASVGQEQVIKTSLTQDIDFLEVLSLKLNQTDTYKLHVSNYGIIVGRVLANEAFGIPNAKVSVFIKLSDEDNEKSDIANLYPYKNITTNNKENKRYNLLSDSSNDDCYRIVGTFPNKRLVLDNETEIEIYDKYWKYTTVTNQSGDYMIFGVPTGNQTVHVDIDLSDIGILSQKPRDFFYKGYNKEQFDSAEQFKEGSDLDNLTQLLSQNTSVYVYPFFGDKSENDIAITRCDIKVPYKFEPTCIFLGSIISDKKGQHIGHSCGPSRKVGYNSNLMTGEGIIEMIRRTPDGLVEEFPIKANRLIDGDGVWCYQIPMNLDYIGTDEFGNIIPVQDTTKGIPTRTSVRFRISLQETTTAPSAEHVAKHLVPSVHEIDAQTNEPHILNGSLYDNCYEFGSATPKEFFRDLLWNKVYSVKSFIPRFEHKNKSGKNYMGIRSVNSDLNKNNVFPFNSARFELKFTYRILCTIMTIVVDILGFYNKLVSEVICWKLEISFKVLGKRIRLNFGRPLKFLSEWIKCIGMKGEWFFEELSDTYFFPSCDKDCGSLIEEDGLKVNKDKGDLKDRIQQALSLEYDLVNLDFHNDWVNGTLYFPLWFWRKRAKKKYFFGLFSSRAKNTFCSCDNTYGALALTQGCSVNYDSSFQPINISKDVNHWHKLYDGRQVKYGIIKEFTNRDGLNIYYYSPGSPNDLGYKTNKGLTSFSQLFATDIILLGSLNSCDLDNLPKTFDSLPSTTVNLPFIATFDSDASGDGIVTGLDWGHDAYKDPIKYQNGLLIDLKCWNIYTRYKSCVNLSRLSELHVTFDMDMSIEDSSEPNIVHDGLITEKELVEHETRAKFASLNHNGLYNLTKNPTTNYDTYKFHYVYPVNFDGHLESVKIDYSNSKTFSDISDSNYIMYRLGEGKDSSSSVRHKKHFYNGTENNFTFPLYNNSFYFYFGLNEGSTAIDKFNTQFNALCTKQNKFSFTIEYNSKAGKWCYNPSNIATDFGTIDVEFEGLTDTFSYTLYNEFNEELISEENVTNNNLKFGYDIKKGGGSYIMTNSGYKKDGRLKEFKTGELVLNSFGEPIFLENGIYYLEVTNSFGLKVTQKINMIQNVLSPNIEEIKLGTKYIQGKTKASDICGEMDFYGEIRIKSFTIDGEDAYVQSIETYYLDGIDHYYVIDSGIVYPIDGVIEYNNVNYTESFNENDNTWSITINGTTYTSLVYEQPKEVTCKVTCTDGSQVYLILEPENDETQDISNFVCYGVGNIQSARLEQQGEKDGVEIYTLIFNMWKPGDYVLTSNQVCNNILNDNVSVNTISIENGDRFQAFINNVPFKLANSDYFKGKLIPYAEDISSITSTIKDTFPRPWLQLENPQVYGFSGTKFNNIDFWDDFLDITTATRIDEDETVTYITSSSKIDILSSQINTIAEMRKIGYIMGESDIPQITITSKGGKEPIIIRNIHPNYNTLDEENYICDSILIDNSYTLQAPLLFPYIVDNFYQNTRNYNGGEEYKIRLNKLVYPSLTNKLGNYFAVFTNNGGMVNMLNDETKHDNTIYVESSPEGAKPITSIPTTKAVITNKYPQALFQKGSEYLRTMFVDKRITYSGEFYLPIICNYKVYEENDTIWKYGYFPVKIFKVAPLVYDDDYNIIGKNLSYDIKQVTDELFTEEIVSYANKNNNTKIYYTINGTNYSLTFTSKSYFNGISYGFTYNNTISGNSFDDILVKIRSICDDIAENINFIYNNNIAVKLTYNKIIDIADATVFSQDSNIKLTSKLMWYSDLCDLSLHKKYYCKNARLYKCSFSVDDEETDVRDEFENYIYGSENYGTNKQISFSTHKKSGLTIPFGSTFKLEASNCKMIGDLTYEIEKDDENKEHYIFKSKVESSDVATTSLDIGQRINVISSAFFYEPINHGKYFSCNGQRVFLGKRDESLYKKYYVYSHSPKTSSEVANLYSIIDGNEIQLESTNSNLKCKYQLNSMNGFVWFKKTLLYASWTTLEGRISSEGMQQYLNKYGVPIYCYLDDVSNFYYTFNPYIETEIVTLSAVTSTSQINETSFTVVNSNDYYCHESNNDDNENNNNPTVKADYSYSNIVFKIKIDDELINVIIPFERYEFLSYIHYNPNNTNISGYFYKKIETNNSEKRGVIANPYKITYNNDLSKIESSQLEFGNNYKVSTFVRKEWIQSYVISYYYFPINYNAIKNPYINYDNLYNIHDIFDGKQIQIQVYTNYDKINVNLGNAINGIYKPTFSGPLDAMAFVNFVFEKNELNDRFYLRELDGYGNTVKYHKLQYLYQRYVSDVSTTDYFYDGSELLEHKYGTVINVETHYNNLLHTNSKITTSVPNNLSNDPHILNDDAEKTYKGVCTSTITFKKSGDTVEYASELYDVRELSFTQFDISSIDDFSCKIDMDSSNDDCDSITTDAPFLSLGVSKRYNLKKVDDELVFFDINELSIPIWSIPESNKNLVVNADRIVTDFEEEITNACLLNDVAYAIYDNKLYDYYFYKPKYDSNGYLVDSSNNKLRNSKNIEVSVHWTDVIELYYKITNKDKILNNKTNTLVNVSYSLDDATAIFESIVWVNISITAYKNLIETTTSNKFFQHRSIKKTLIIPRGEINLIQLGDRRYYQGEYDINNILKENITNKTKRWGNTNIPYFIPKTSNEDSLLVRKYKSKSAVIGETYPYLYKFTFGALEEKENENGKKIKVFTPDSNEDGNEITHFFQSNSLGFNYGDYLPIFKYHPLRISKIIRYNIKNPLVDIRTFNENSNFDGRLAFHSFKPRLNGVELYESDENYDNLLYAYQRNTKYDIPKGTNIISCNFGKSYYDSNKDFNYKLIETFSQSFTFHVGSMYFGNTFDVRIISDSTIGAYSLVKKLPIYLFDNHINEDLKRAFDDNNFTYYFNQKAYTYNLEETVKGVACPQLTYYSAYDNGKFINSIGINTDGSIVNGHIYNGFKIQLDEDKYGENLYLMEFDDNKLENRNEQYNLCTIFKFTYENGNYYFSILDPYLLTPFGKRSINKTQIEEYLDTIINKYNVTQLGVGKYNVYYNEEIDEDEDTELPDDGDNGGDEGGDEEIPVVYYTVKIPINLYTSPTLPSFQRVYVEFEIAESLIETQTSWNKLSSILNSGTRFGVSNGFITLVHNNVAYYLRTGSKTGNKIATSTNDDLKFVESQTESGIYILQGYDVFFACNDESEAPSVGGGIGGSEWPGGDGSDDKYTDGNGGNNNGGASGWEDPLIPNLPINPLSETDEGIEIISEEDGFTSENEINREEEFKNSVLNLSGSTDLNEILMYDYRVVGYPVKIVHDGSPSTNGGLETNKEHTLKYLGFVSNLVSTTEDDFRTLEKKGITYPRYKAFGTYNFNNNDSSKDLLEIDYIKDTQIEVNGLSKTSYHMLVVPYAVAKVSEQKLVQITCSDGYVVNGTQYERIMCINGNGEKEEYTFNTLLSQGVLGLYIYHIETIDGVNYDFVSQISNIKTVGSSYLLTVDCDDLINKQNVVLSIATNNLVHKFPFHYKNGQLKPGFYDKILDYDDEIEINKKEEDDNTNVGGSSANYNVLIHVFAYAYNSNSYTLITVTIKGLSSLKNITWNNIITKFLSTNSPRFESEDGYVILVNGNNRYKVRVGAKTGNQLSVKKTLTFTKDTSNDGYYVYSSNTLYGTQD